MADWVVWSFSGCSLCQSKPHAQLNPMEVIQAQAI